MRTTGPRAPGENIVVSVWVYYLEHPIMGNSKKTKHQILPARVHNQQRTMQYDDEETEEQVMSQSYEFVSITNEVQEKNPNQKKLIEEVIYKQIQHIVILVEYAEKKHDSDKDYFETALAYQEVLNLYTSIVLDPNTSTNIREWLLPHAKRWLTKYIALKNVIHTEDSRNKTSKAEAEAESKAFGAIEPPIDFQAVLDELLHSSETNHIPAKIKNKISSMAAILPLSKPGEKLTDVIGSEGAKQHSLETIIFGLRDEVCKDFRDGLPMGVCYYGQSGTGKYFLAKAIANEGNCTFIEVKPRDIVSKINGESAENIAAIFHLARLLQPSIIFFHDIESLLPEDEKTLSMFLNEMQGVKGGQVFVIGSTNNPLNIAEAFRCRFQRFIHVKMPNLQALSAMMQKWYMGHNHTISKAEFDYMAIKLDGMAPTYIKKLMDFALTKRRSEFYGAEAHKIKYFEDGAKYVACTLDDPLALPKQTMTFLLDKKCAVKPVTSSYLFNFILRAKPAVNPLGYKDMLEFEAKLGTLC